MKFSVHLPTCQEGLMLPIGFARPEDFVRLGQACERLGYDGVWGNDHLTRQEYVRRTFPHAQPNFYEVMVTLATVAATTSRLRVGTAVAVLPMRDPVLLAKQAATLDQLSAGRLSLGVGIGAYREEFEAWNPRLRTARRVAMLDEGFQALDLLLTQPSASFDGEFYAFRGVELFPKPKQHPFPIYVGGHNLAAVERAARWGHGWMPGWRPLDEMKARIDLLRERATALGRDAGGIDIAPQLSVTLAKTVEEAEERHLGSGLVAHRVSLNVRGRDLSRQVELNLVGSPAAVVEKVARYQAVGVDHCSALIFPTNTVDEMLDQLHWFAEEVMRHFPSTVAV